MNHLPDEILIKIFKELSLLERVRFCRVSRRWSCLCCHGLEEISVESWFLQDKYDHVQNSNIQSKNRIYFQLDKQSKIYPVFCLLVKKAGNSLRKVKFVDHYESKQLKFTNCRSRHRTKYFKNFAQTLIENCPNLISLSIYFQFQNHGVKTSAIEMLIKYYGLQLEELHLVFRYKIIFFQFLNPLKLQKFTFDFRYDSPNNVQFVCENFPLLTDLTITFSGLLRDNVFLHFSKLKHLKRLDLEVFLKVNTFKIIQGEDNFVANLKHFSFRSFDMKPEEPQWVGWNKFESLCSFSSKIEQSDKFEQILTHLPKLQELFLIFDRYFAPDFFDFNSLSQLKFLKKLKVKRFLHYQQITPKLNFKTVDIPMNAIKKLTLVNLTDYRPRSALSILDIEIDIFKQVSRVFPNIRLFHIMCNEISSENLKINCLDNLIHLQELFIQTDYRKFKTETSKLLRSEYQKLLPYCKCKNIDFKLA